MYHEYFPPVVMALQEEIQRHQALLEQLCQLPANSDLSDKLGTVAAFCGIAMDGLYDNDSLLKLCEILRTKLIEAREELIRDISAPIVKQ